MVFRVFRFETNQQHAKARQKGIDLSSYPYVALMDSDDVSVPCRFELQMSAFSANPDLSVVGGQINEFVGSEDCIQQSRQVPLKHEGIITEMRSRCAMNQVTVMFKKDDIMGVGGYIDWFWNEDYYLWVRMMKAGCRFGNIPEVLVNVRTGADMYRRRGGWRYFKSEAGIQRLMLKERLISFPRYIYNVTKRFGGEYLAPSFVRGWLFKMLRTAPLPMPSALSEKGYGDFSLTMSVYKGDNPVFFDRALRSILVEQTLKPREFVLVVDGPVPQEIDEVIDRYKKMFQTEQ